MTFIDKQCTWTLKVGGSELEYLTRALEFIANTDYNTGSHHIRNELISIATNYDGRQFLFIESLAKELRAELDREYPPEESREDEV